MPDELPVYEWGESVTWARGTILVPLGRGDDVKADLRLTGDEARLLAVMLHDAAGPEPAPAPCHQSQGTWGSHDFSECLRCGLCRVCGGCEHAGVAIERADA